MSMKMNLFSGFSVSQFMIAQMRLKMIEIQNTVRYVGTDDYSSCCTIS